jgi:hypothetical protein
MLYRLINLSNFLQKNSFKIEANLLNSLIKYAEETCTTEEEGFSIIDLMPTYQSGVVIKDKAKDRIINYSEDGNDFTEAPTGNNFTEKRDSLNKSALGLTGVPYGSPDGNVSHRLRDTFKQDDFEVANKFFGAESNIDSEESQPPANIEDCNNKPINIPDETGIDTKSFFEYLNLSDGIEENKD